MLINVQNLWDSYQTYLTKSTGLNLEDAVKRICHNQATGRSGWFVLEILQKEELTLWSLLQKGEIRILAQDTSPGYVWGYLKTLNPTGGQPFHRKAFALGNGIPSNKKEFSLPPILVFWSFEDEGIARGWKKQEATIAVRSEAVSKWKVFDTEIGDVKGFDLVEHD